MNRRAFIAASAGAAAFLFVAACGRVGIPEARASAPPGELPNGLYRVTAYPASPDSTAAVPYDPRLADETSTAPPTWVALDSTDYVPLVIDAPPLPILQSDGRLRLQITLANEHVRTLAGFTSRNVGGRAAIVLDHEVVSVHKQRAVITDGRMQISRCTDRACERILTKLMGGSTP